MTMKNEPEFIEIDDNMRQCPEDWRFLIQCLSREPTLVRQLVSKLTTATQMRASWDRRGVV